MTNMCPNCKSTDIDKQRYSKYTSAGCIGFFLLFILGPIAFLVLMGFVNSLVGIIAGVVFILPAIVLWTISGYKYKCKSCGAEWK